MYFIGSSFHVRRLERQLYCVMHCVVWFERTMKLLECANLKMQHIYFYFELCFQKNNADLCSILFLHYILPFKCSRSQLYEKKPRWFVVFWGKWKTLQKRNGFFPSVIHEDILLTILTIQRETSGYLTYKINCTVCKDIFVHLRSPIRSFIEGRDVMKCSIFIFCAKPQLPNCSNLSYFSEKVDEIYSKYVFIVLIRKQTL